MTDAASTQRAVRPTAARPEGTGVTRVLQLIHTTGPGGAETVCFDLARGMDPRRWSTLVCVPEEGWITTEMRAAEVPYVIVPPRGRVAFTRKLCEVLRGNRIDLIHAHLLGSAFYASVAGLLCSLPVVSTLHGLSDVDGPRGLIERLRFGAIRHGSRRVVCVSRSLRDDLLRYRRFPACNTEVIENGVDVSAFRQGGDRSFRTEIGVTDEQVLVGAVGNLRSAKDYPTFMRAAAALAGRSPLYRFVVVGDDRWGLDELTTLRRELGLDDRLVFAGFRADVARVFSALDIYVLSSRTEGFSLTAVQAMASGVPVVATRCGGPEEIIRSGREGVLVPVGDAGAIADAVEDLWPNPALRQQLGDAARRRAVERYSTSAMIARYERLFSATLAAHARRGPPAPHPEAGEPARE